MQDELARVQQCSARPLSSLSSAVRTCAPPLLSVEAGDVTLGKPVDWPSYGWDNEYGSRTFHVRAFKASKALVRWADWDAQQLQLILFARQAGTPCFRHLLVRDCFAVRSNIEPPGPFVTSALCCVSAPCVPSWTAQTPLLHTAATPSSWTLCAAAATTVSSGGARKGGAGAPSATPSGPRSGCPKARRVSARRLVLF